MNHKPLAFTLAALMCALFSPKPATAQSLPVIPEKNRPAIVFWDKAPDEKASPALNKMSSVLSTLLTTEFQKQGDQQVTVVLPENLSDKALEEQARALTGVVDPKTAAEIGKLMGAKYSVIATITRFDSDSKAITFDPKDFPLPLKIAYKKWEEEMTKKGKNIDTVEIVNFVPTNAKLKTVTFFGKLNVDIYDIETQKLVSSADEEDKNSKVGFEVMKIGNNVYFNDTMVSAVFEPIVQKITPKLIKGLIDKLN